MEAIRYALSSLRWHYDHLNTFDLFANDTINSLHNEYDHKYSLSYEKMADPIGPTKFLQRNWHHSVTIVTTYYILVRCLQRVMRHRAPFHLQRALFLWNTALAIFSFVGFIRTFEELWYSLGTLGVYRSVCYGMDPFGVSAFWGGVFITSKLFEFGDTIFIVLRKKPLIFLHYYHHAIVYIGVTHAGAEHAAPGRYFMVLNFFVHSAMYGYFAYNAYGFRPSKTVGMLLTFLQIVQMVCGVYVEYLVVHYKVIEGLPCQQSWKSFWFHVFEYGSYIILFVHFFYTKYLTTAKQRQQRKKAE